jgi:hypothetical protein
VWPSSLGSIDVGACDLGDRLWARHEGATSLGAGRRTLVRHGGRLRSAKPPRPRTRARDHRLPNWAQSDGRRPMQRPRRGSTLEDRALGSVMGLRPRRVEGSSVRPRHPQGALVRNHRPPPTAMIIVARAGRPPWGSTWGGPLRTWDRSRRPGLSPARRLTLLGASILGSIRIESGVARFDAAAESPTRRSLVATPSVFVEPAALSGVCDEIPVNRRATPDWRRRRPT